MCGAHLINPEFRGEEAIGPDFNCALEKRRKGLAGVALMQSPHGGRMRKVGKLSRHVFLSIFDIEGAH